MKWSNATVSLVIGTVVLLSGCGTNNPSQSQPAEQTAPSSGSMSAKQSTEGGLKTMLGISQELNTKISAGDDAGIRNTAPKLEETWASFEDSIKQTYPAPYSQVEQYLNPLVAGSKVTPPDRQVLSQLNSRLGHVLKELSQQVNK